MVDGGRFIVVPFWREKTSDRRSNDISGFLTIISGFAELCGSLFSTVQYTFNVYGSSMSIKK
jgi:hypothetical protein